MAEKTTVTALLRSVLAAVTREVDIQVSKIEFVATVVAGSGPGNLIYTVTAFNGGPVGASDRTSDEPMDRQIRLSIGAQQSVRDRLGRIGAIREGAAFAVPARTRLGTDRSARGDGR